MNATPDLSAERPTAPATAIHLAPTESGRASATIDGDHLAVVLAGEIDLALAAVLAQTLAQTLAELPPHGMRADVDASAVTFADCTLLAFLVPLSRLTRLALTSSPAVRDLLLVAGVPSSFGQPD